MGYYSGNAMSMHGSYCIHYGRKGMKWYQTIFGDMSEAVRSGYHGASSVANKNNRYDPTTKSFSNNGVKRFARYNQVYGYKNQKALQGDLVRNVKGDGARYDPTTGKFTGNMSVKYNGNPNNYNKFVGNVGSFVGATAYNATVVADRIAEAAKKAWFDVKRIGAPIIAKGWEILKKIGVFIGTNAKKAGSAIATGAKKAGSAIATGAQKAGSAIATGAQKAGSKASIAATTAAGVVSDSSRKRATTLKYQEQMRGLGSSSKHTKYDTNASDYWSRKKK